MGMMICRSEAASSSGQMPCPSLPMTTRWRIRSTSRRSHAVSDSAVAAMGIPAAWQTRRTSSIGALCGGRRNTAPMEARTVFFGKRIGAAVRQQDRQVEGVGRAQDRAEVSGVLDAVEQEHAGLHPERALLRQAQENKTPCGVRILKRSASTTQGPRPDVPTMGVPGSAPARSSERPSPRDTT